MRHAGVSLWDSCRTIFAAAACAVLLAGCGGGSEKPASAPPPPPPPPAAPAAQPAPAPTNAPAPKSTAQGIIEDMAGKTAIDQGRKAQDKIRAISEQRNKDLDEVTK
jgi:hypothetical protein